MTEQLNELLATEQLNEVDLTDFIRTYKKLVDLNVLHEPWFESILSVMGIENPEENTYVLNEDIIYTFS
jgi:hypothetical protein